MKTRLNTLAKGKHLNFMIYPDQGKGISFRVSKIVAYALVGVLGILIALFIVFAISLGEISHRAFLAKSLLQENEKLRDYNARVTELERELNEYRDLTLHIAQLAGVEGAFENRSASTSQGTGQEQVPSIQTEKGNVILSGDEPQGAVIGDSIPFGLPLDGWISKGFIQDPKSLGGAHPGIDIAASVGKEVRVTASGLVKFAGWDDHYGNLIIIDHKNGYETYYGHNSQLQVSKQEKVQRGQVIALSGNSGRSSAPHLHYEIKKDGVSVNPEKYLGKKDEK